MLLWLLCVPFVGMQAQTTLYSEGFETDGEGTRYTSNAYYEASPNCNFFGRFAASPLDVCFGPANVFTNFQGSFFWAGEDVMRTGATLPAGNLTTSLINITGYGSLNVSLFLATSNNVTPANTRWEFADSINVQASINGGTFRTVGRFMGNGVTGGDLIRDVNLNGVADVGEPVVSLNAFTNYTFNIAGTGTSLRIRLDYDEIGGSEESGIDQLVVRGTLVVPVRWAHFSAKPAGREVMLDWSTTEEVNAKEFVVERLSGQGTYAPIGTMAAKGEASSYHFVDAAPVIGESFYRIRQLDMDNAESFSEAVAVNYTAPIHMQIYPNPTQADAKIGFGGREVSGHFLLLDALGQVVQDWSFDAATELDVRTAGLSAGIYFVRITPQGEPSLTQKMILRP